MTKVTRDRFMIAKTFCMRGTCEGLSVPRRDSFFVGDGGFFMARLREAKTCPEGSRAHGIRQHARQRGTGFQPAWSENVRAKPPPPAMEKSRGLAEHEPCAFPKLNPPPSARHPPPISRAQPPFSRHPPTISRAPPAFSLIPPPFFLHRQARTRIPPTIARSPPPNSPHPPTPSRHPPPLSRDPQAQSSDPQPKCRPPLPQSFDLQTQSPRPAPESRHPAGAPRVQSAAAVAQTMAAAFA
jgi:hypothetical protein